MTSDIYAMWARDRLRVHVSLLKNYFRVFTPRNMYTESHWLEIHAARRFCHAGVTSQKKTLRVSEEKSTTLEDLSVCGLEKGGSRGVRRVNGDVHHWVSPNSIGGGGGPAPVCFRSHQLAHAQKQRKIAMQPLENKSAASSPRAAEATAAPDASKAKNSHRVPSTQRGAALEASAEAEGFVSLDMKALECEGSPPLTQTAWGAKNLSTPRRGRAFGLPQQVQPPALQGASEAHERHPVQGADIAFESVLPHDINKDAEHYVEDFLRQNMGPQLEEQKRASAAALSAAPGRKYSAAKVEVHNVPRSNRKCCVLQFYIAGRLVRAAGQSTRSKVARMLCFMHAVKLIDYYSAKQELSSPPPLPLLEEDTNRMKLRRRSSFASQRSFACGAASSSFSGDFPRPGAFETWVDYVSACRTYINCEQEAAREEALLMMRIPPSTNDIVNYASEMFQRDDVKHDPVRGVPYQHALERLNVELRDAGKLIQTMRMGSKIFVATLPLEESTDLVATGVGCSAKEAKRRCAAHALCILKLLQERLLPMRHTDPTFPGVLANTKKANDASTHSCGNRFISGSPVGTILCSLNSHYDTMYKLYRFLFNDMPDPAIDFTKQGNTFVCQFSLSGVTCKGHGINSFEAQRAATEAALSKLELYDERLKAIREFALQYPGVTLSSIPTVVLPTKLSERVQTGIKKINERFPSTHNGCDGAQTNGGFEECNKVVSDAEKAMLARYEKGRAGRDFAYAERMRHNLRALHANPVYLQKFHLQRSTLAIASVKQQILDAVATNQVTIICGMTACGKTTQVPQYLLDHEIMEGRGDMCNIIVAQPRRITAFSVADRIAQERLSAIGKDVGYAIRLESKIGLHINLYTFGVLLQILSSQPYLDQVSHLIIDEVHERDINCDVILALAKQILCKNTTIKIILMSATMHSSMFASYFGSAPVITAQGSVYPVQVRYLEDIIALTTNPGPNFNSYSSPMFGILNQQNRLASKDSSYAKRSSTHFTQRRYGFLTPQKTDYQLIAYLIYYSIHVDLRGDTKGKSILVFLPGWKELLAAKRVIESMDDIFVNGKYTAKVKFKIIILHSTVDGHKQRECFLQAPDGFVKVVLATNIAESGITIDDAAVVIDTGLIKQTAWTLRVAPSIIEDAGKNPSIDDADIQQTTSFSTQLSLSYASQANMTQRKGRAGRTQEGFCYRIFTRHTWEALPTFQEPEIHRVPLTQVLLKLLSLGYNSPKSTLATFMEPPSPTNVEVSMKLLKDLDAVTADEKLTSLGYYLSKLPCDPRIGKMMMMGTVLHCLDSVLTVAASADVCPFVTNRDFAMDVRKSRFIFSRNSQSDHISFLNAYNGFCVCGGDTDFARLNYLHSNNLEIISKYKQQYSDILYNSGLISRDDLLPEVFKSGLVSTKDALEASDDLSHIEANGFDVEARHHDATGLNLGSCNRALFVDASILSRQAYNVALVKACICAAFFPNVAVLDPPSMFDSATEGTRSGSRKRRLRTKAHPAIAPAADSVCHRLGIPRDHGAPTCEEYFLELAAQAQSSEAHNTYAPATYYVYQEIFAVREANKTFLTGLSSISLWSLLLFGASDANIRYFSTLGLCVVDGWIFVRVDHATFRILHDLRHTLHDCVWRKYKDPTSKANNAALSTLRELIQEVLEAPLDASDSRLNCLGDGGMVVLPRAKGGQKLRNCQGEARRQ